MVNFLRMELKKVLGMTRYSEDATYIGSCGYVKVNEDVRMRLEFSRSSTTTYDGIVLTMLNRKDGTVDTNALKFRDIWGKKAVSNPAHTSSNTPPVTPGAWLYGNAKRFTTEPQEPAFWSFAPNTTRGIRALIIAPAHIGQGSNVTYSVHCHRRQPPNARQAPSIASNSAWQSAFFPTSRRFRPRAITRS